MSLLLSILAFVLLWLGIDALWLARHSFPPAQLVKDRMTFGEVPKRAIPAVLRTYLERRAPFATAGSMTVYGILFIVGGLLAAWLAWESRT